MNALVMYDHQTETLWSQFLARGVKGPLAGVALDLVPVTQTTWETWRVLHPDTLVLDKEGSYRIDSYLDDAYDSYYRNNKAGVLGETVDDDRLRRKDLVLGLEAEGRHKAYPFRLLEGQPVLNDVVSGKDVLVFFDDASGTALAYDRGLGDLVLTFRADGNSAGAQTVLVDEETGSRWLALTGRAVEGELKGEQLDRLPSHLSFWFAWKDWNPDTALYLGSKRALKAALGKLDAGSVLVPFEDEARTQPEIRGASV